MKNSFVVYTDNTEYLDELTDEQVGILYRAEITYSRGTEPVINDPLVRIVFKMVKAQMDRDREKYEKKIDRINSLNEARKVSNEVDTKSSRSRHEVDTKSSRSRNDIESVNVTVTDTVNVTDTVTVNVTDTVSPSEIEKKNSPTESKKKRRTYGAYGGVLLTDDELERLNNQYGETQTQEAIEFLSEYKKRKGYKCRDDNLTLRKWVFDALEEDKRKRGRASPGIDWSNV